MVVPPRRSSLRGERLRRGGRSQHRFAPVHNRSGVDPNRDLRGHRWRPRTQHGKRLRPMEPPTPIPAPSRRLPARPCQSGALRMRSTWSFGRVVRYSPRRHEGRPARDCAHMDERFWALLSGMARASGRNAEGWPALASSATRARCWARQRRAWCLRRRDVQIGAGDVAVRGMYRRTFILVVREP